MEFRMESPAGSPRLDILRRAFVGGVSSADDIAVLGS
jgi:hypothetical protein